jgi:hypothetical protein
MSETQTETPQTETQKQLQRYVDAAKLDMLELFDRPTLSIYEFRKLADVCEIMEELCDAASAGFISPQAVHRALWASEIKAPTLHKALGGHVFDADTLLKAKYETMARQHEELRLKLAFTKKAETEYVMRGALLAERIEEITIEEGALADERKLLEMRSKELDERHLALTEGEARLKQLSSGDAVVGEIEPEGQKQEGEAP